MSRFSERLDQFNFLFAVGATLAAIMFFSGCAPIKIRQGPPCQSKCGLVLDETSNGALSCESLQEAEDHVLGAFDELKDKDPRLAKDEMCKSFYGYQIHLPKQPVGSDGQMLFVGLTNCQTKDVWLFQTQDWRQGSFAHEMVHVGQHCEPPESWVGVEDEYVGYGHTGWIDNGVYSIITEIKRGLR